MTCFLRYLGRGFDSRRLHHIGKSMNDELRKALNKEQLLYTMLTALIKKNDGEIRITEKEMDAVTKYDNIMVYYDKTHKEIIITSHLIETPFQNEVF